MHLTLDELDTRDPADERPRTVEGTALSAEDTQTLLERLPAFRGGGDRETSADFSFPPETRPPSRSGRTIEETFPPDRGRSPETTAPPEGPLEVVRVAPEGEVELARRLSTTFSHPMVPLTSQSRAAETVPVRLEPQPEGQWRWLGTKTLVFEPEGGRLPMATDYEARLDVDTESTDGASLESAFDWSFQTPPVRIAEFHPNDDEPQGRRPTMFARFNQRIDPEAMLEHLVLWGGGDTWTLERIPTSRLDEPVAGMAQRAPDGQWLAVRPTRPLPPATRFRVESPEGAPSAEGPKRSNKGQRFSFRTYEPLEIEEVDCGGYGGCRPGYAWSIEFNNALDEETFDPERLEIEPELRERDLQIHGDRLVVSPRSEGHRTYELQLPPNLTDVFGQQLGDTDPLTIEVGAAEPRLHVPQGAHVLLDPAGPPTFPVWTVNYASIDVRVRMVEPSDWFAYASARRSGFDSDDDSVAWPGETVFERTFDVEAELGDVARTPIDLSEALEDTSGHLVVEIEPNRRIEGAPEPDDHVDHRAVTWLQSTDVGLDAFVDGDRVVVWATSLTTGTPLEGVEVEMLTERSETSEPVTTDADGIASFPVPEPPESDESSPDLERSGSPSNAPPVDPVLVARRDGDTAVVPDVVSPMRNLGERDGLRWYVFDDRHLYQPGETVHLKGWLRRGTDDASAPLEQPDEGATIRYAVSGPRGTSIAEGEATVGEHGGFDLTVELPEDVSLGRASLQVELRSPDGDGRIGEPYRHHFRIQTFRTPEFEVDVATRSPGPHLVGETVEVQTEAAYYTGGSLPGAEVDWGVRPHPTSYTPPGWEDFAFGDTTPFPGPVGEVYDDASKQLSGRTDARGRHRLAIETHPFEPPRPMAVTAEASVADVDRQIIAARDTFLVHPARSYVGLRTPRHFVEADDALEVEAVATDIEGQALESASIEMRAARLEWERRKGEWQSIEKDPESCTATFEGGDPISCRFQPGRSGIYRVRATVEDDEGRLNQSSLHIWVAGDSGITRPEQPDEADVELVADRDRYEPGETADILIHPPFTPAEGLVTIRRDGIVETRRVHIESGTGEISYDIDRADIPDVHVGVDLVGAVPREGGEGDSNGSERTRPAFASGHLELGVSRAMHRLDVDVRPDAPTRSPGDEVTLDFEVTGAGGDPASNTEVAVAVVDEAILSLTDQSIGDPLAAFHPTRGDVVRTLRSRRELLIDRLVEPDMGLERETMRQRAAAASGRSESSLSIRRDFQPLVHFAPSLETDEQGRATTTFELPDNLTRYRVVAVAAGETAFGTGTSQITARRPLMVRPSPPRFLNYGDRAEMPIVIENRTDDARDVRVATRATNLELKDSRGRQLTIPAGDRVEVRWSTETDRVGTARLQVGVVSGPWTDATEIEFPVYTPATTEAFAAYGTIEEEEEETIRQPIAMPDDALDTFGGLEITTASTALHQLSDAARYLFDSPWDFAEPIASRLLAVAALEGLPDALRGDALPDDEALRARIEHDLEQLRRLQTSSGGFALVPNRHSSGSGERILGAHGGLALAEAHPFVSVHVAHALQRLRSTGYEPPEGMFERVLSYLREIEEHLSDPHAERVRRTILAYSLYVRDRAGDSIHMRARRLLERPPDALPMEALGWLTAVLADDASSEAQLRRVRRHVLDRIEETASTAHLATSYGEDGHVVAHSDRRTDAIVLDALLEAPFETAELVPKLARGLLASRSSGRWGNTQENAFALLALRHYFERYEGDETPDFTADVWLSDRYVGRHAFEGRTRDRKRTSIPMETMHEILGSSKKTSDADEPGGSKRDALQLRKQGEGRLYYRLGLEYAPASFDLEPAERGFAVERTYEPVDEDDDVTRREDGTWLVEAGARVRVRVEMFAPVRRHHVTLVDPLPAGFEPLNPELETTAAIPDDPEDDEDVGPYWWWYRPWYEHQNLRDTRAEVFASSLWEGVHTYSYVARATTPGTFVVPPARAEELYHPETFGRSGTARVVVE